MEKSNDLKLKLPLDVKIVSWWYICAFVFLIIIALLEFTYPFIKQAYPDIVLTKREVINEFFNLVCLDSFNERGIYYLFEGLLDIVIGIGLLRGKQFAWYLGVIGDLYGLLNGLFSKSVFPTYGLILYFLMLIWFFYRKKIFFPEHDKNEIINSSSE